MALRRLQYPPHSLAPHHSTEAWVSALEITFRRVDPLEKDKFLLDLAPFNPLFPAGFYSVVAVSRWHRPSLSQKGWDRRMGPPPSRQLPATPSARRVREDEKRTKNGNFCQLGNKKFKRLQLSNRFEDGAILFNRALACLGDSSPRNACTGQRPSATTNCGIKSVITEAGKHNSGSGSDRTEACISKQGVGSGI